MPVSTRQPVVAAIAGWISAALAAFPLVQAAFPLDRAAVPLDRAAPTVAASGSPTPTANVTQRATPRPAGQAVPPVVTLTVTAAGNPLPTYRIEVRNSSNNNVDATVRQELPRGAAATAISGGGQVAAPDGPDRGSEVSWQLRLPAHRAATLSSTLVPPTGGAPVAVPACAFTPRGDTPYDCATASWDEAATRTVAPASTPWWRRPAMLGGGLIALLVLLVLTSAGWLGWRVRQRRSVLRRAASRQRAGVAAYDPNATRGTLYPRPAAPRRMAHRTPPAWLVVGMATAVLAGIAAAVVWTATTQVSAIQADRQPTSGAWVGKGAAGPIGTTLRESAFEFTVYRLACPPAARRCQATVGLRNLTPQEQRWYGSLQRAYLPNGNWVTTDEAATRAANGNRDPFDSPVPAGGRLLLPLVFALSGHEPPTQIELRSAVFSAGVRVNVE